MRKSTGINGQRQPDRDNSPTVDHRNLFWKISDEKRPFLLLDKFRQSLTGFITAFGDCADGHIQDHFNFNGDAG
jgi:hypothetical protein